MRFIDPPIGLPTSTLRFEHPDLQRPSHFTERPTDADASVKYSRLASDVRERISGNMYGSVGPGEHMCRYGRPSLRLVVICTYIYVWVDEI